MNKISKTIFAAIFFCAAFAVGNMNAFGQKGDVGEEVRVKFPRGKTSTLVAGNRLKQMMTSAADEASHR